MRSLDPLYGCNGDLWTRFAEIYIDRSAPMRFTWIKSHQTARMVASGAFPRRDLHGNILADAFAEKAAELAQLPEGTVQEYFSARATAHHIRKRLIAVHRSINRHEVEHGKQDVVRLYKEKRQPKPSMTRVYADDLLRQLGHEPSFFEAKGATCFQCRLCKCASTIRKIGDITRAGRCTPVVPLQPTYIERAEEIIRNDGGEETDPARNIEQWRHAIRTARQEPAMPPAMATQPPMIGKTRVHQSHCIQHDRGVFICTQCGAYATQLARKLADPCPGATTTGTAAFLKRFKDGKFPRSGGHYPDPFTRLPSCLIWRPR